MHTWKRMSIEEKTFRAVGYTLITGFAILCLIPFLIIIASSFSSESYIIQHGYGLIPGDFTLESYASIFKNPASVFRAYGVTTVVTVVGTIGGIFINTMTGYVLQRKDFPWRNKFPWYILCIKYLKLGNSLLALILPTMVSVWNILLVKGFMAGIPFEITESGKIDGAGDFRIFVQLILPLAKPVIATIGLFTALTYWNDWYNSMLFITDENLYSLQYLLYKLVGSAQEMRRIMDETGMNMDVVPVESMKMALTVVVTGPIILLYPFVQKYFVKGLTVGAVKG